MCAVSRLSRGRNVLILLVLCHSVSPAQEFPLTLAAEVQLPGDGPWDLQHWMDDSTYGWAQILNYGDVHFVPRLHSPTQVHSILLGDSIYGFRSPDLPPICVALARDESWPTQPIVVAGVLDNTGSQVDLVVVTRDVLTGVRLGHDSMRMWEVTGWWGRTNELRQFSVWPPVPFTSAYLLLVTVIEGWYDGAGYESWDNYGHAGLSTMHEHMSVWSANSSSVSLFSRYDGIDLAFTTYLSQREYSETLLWPNCQSWNAVVRYGSVSIVEQTSFLATPCSAYVEVPSCDEFDLPRPCNFQLPSIAQQDSSGVQRMMAGRACIAVPSGDTLWYDPNHAFMYSAVLQGSPDERLLQWRQVAGGAGFAVFDASTNDLLGETTPLLGVPRYTIKLPNRVVEIVTFDNLTRTVRVYKPLISVEQLIVNYFPQQEMVELSWQPTRYAYRYRVYTWTYSEEFAELAAAVYPPAYTASFAVSAPDVKRFYKVVADY